MKSHDKPTWRSRIFGSAYEGDERIKSAADSAGNYSFLLLMFFLYVCMTVGLLIKRPDIYMMSGLFFMSGCLLYLFFMVKTSALSVDFINKGLKKSFFQLVCVTTTYAALYFGLSYLSYDDEASLNLISLAIESLINALLFTVFFVILLKILPSLSNRRIEKKMENDQ